MFDRDQLLLILRRLAICVVLVIALAPVVWLFSIAYKPTRDIFASPPTFLFTATDFNSYVTVSIADGAPQRRNGRMAASTAPGLGITPRLEVLGKPMVVVE